MMRWRCGGEGGHKMTRIAASDTGRAALWVLIVAVLLLAAATRWHMIGEQSLWNDEGTSYVQATRSLGAIADNAARDIHPPGYYWMLAGWVRLVGTSELGLRSLSALAGVLSVALTFALGRRLFGAAVGGLAAGFVALNTFSITYGQEARMYALLAMWGAASMWLFAVFALSANQQTRRRAAPALALVNAAGLYTHYAFPFVMLAQGIAFLVYAALKITAPTIRRDMADWKRQTALYVALNALTLALFAPWLSTALAQITTWPTTGDAIPASEALAVILGYMAFGITSGPGVTIAVAFFLLFALVQARDETDAEARPRAGWRVLVPVLWVAVSVGLFMALDLFREANLKFLLPAQIGFALWMARGVAVLWHIRTRDDHALIRHTPKIAALLGTAYLFVTLGAGLSPLYHDPAYQRDDYRAIVADIESNLHRDDAIILNGAGQAEVFGYYYTGAAEVYPLPEGFSIGDEDTAAQTRAIIARHRMIYAVLWGTDERDPRRVVETTLGTLAYPVDSRWFGDVRLARYAAGDDMPPATALDLRFGDSITLIDYTLSPVTVRAGDAVRLRLTWQAETALDGRYKVFVQLLNPDGVLVAQRDSEPVGDLRPTFTWAAGERISDRHALIIPNDLPPTHYSLIIGLYNADNPSMRLILADGRDYFLLETITIAES
ncbi:MAG: hypothetical protein EA396_10305 [Anaerolineaceae bacterium]|nr:MAG: hypothetical protein EA396_10305 [Anaerolineaceae bacterium]